MSAYFYALAAILIVVACAFVLWPFVRQSRYWLAAVCSLFVLLVVVGLYPQVSSFKPTGPAMAELMAATEPDQAAAAADELAALLAKHPNDIMAWALLGQTRLQFNEFGAAETAFREAMGLATRPDAQLMIWLGESLMYADGKSVPAEAVNLFIEALALSPDNPKAMWYGGLAYAAKGESLAAADTWERLLSGNPPPEVAQLLQARIAALRAEGGASEVATGAQLQLDVALAADLPAEWPPSARLFVAVRDADAAGPPLAAVNLDPAALPLSLSLSDADAMIAGRNLSSAKRYRISARVSMNGQPLGSPGDYLGVVERDAGDQSPVTIIIDTVTP